MNCMKCNGRVFVDLTYTENKSFELFCMRCGKRWFLGKGPLSNIVRSYVDRVMAAV